MNNTNPVLGREVKARGPGPRPTPATVPVRPRRPSDSGPPRARVEWLSWSTLRAFEVQPIGYPHDPYFLPFSRTVMFLASRGCRTTARRRVLVLSLGFRATRCTDPDGSKNVSPAL